MNKEALEKIYIAIEPLVEEMKSRYPKEVNIDGFEPALTSDISEIVYKYLSTHNDSLRKMVEGMRFEYQQNQKMSHGSFDRTVYGAKAEVLDEVLTLLSKEV